MSNRISVAFAQNIYLICYFLQKGKWVLRSLLSAGRYFRGRGLLLPGFANIRYFPGPAEQFLKFGAQWPPTLRWGGWGGGEEQIWLFSLCGCLELSDYWTFLESLLSGVMFINFKWLKSTFLLLSLISHAGSTTRSLKIMILLCRFL